MTPKNPKPPFELVAYSEHDVPLDAKYVERMFVLHGKNNSSIARKYKFSQTFTIQGSFLPDYFMVNSELSEFDLDPESIEVDYSSDKNKVTVSGVVRLDPKVTDGFVMILCGIMIVIDPAA